MRILLTNSAGVPLLGADTVAVAASHQAGVLRAGQGLEVGLEEPLPPPHLVHTLHAETGLGQGWTGTRYIHTPERISHTAGRNWLDWDRGWTGTGAGLGQGLDWDRSSLIGPSALS